MSRNASPPMVSLAQAPSRRRRALLVGAIAATMALAGCTGDGDRDGSVAQLEFSGSGPGTETDTAGCDDDGWLTATGSVREGTVSVVVMDGNSEAIHATFLDGTLTGDTESLNGSPGEWTLEATRSGDFDGEYLIDLGC